MNKMEPFSKLAYFVDKSLPIDDFHLSLKHVVKQMIIHPWSSFSDDDISIDVISGGITNALYLVSHFQDQVIVRLFGEGTEVIIDRNKENLVFSSLSDIESIETPTFYGLFENGRIEGYIKDTITLKPDEMIHDDIGAMVSKELARFHEISIPAININNIFSLWDRIDNFFDLAKVIDFENDKEKQQKFINLNIDMMRDEYNKYKLFISRPDINISNTFKSLGYSFGLERVLCHNDLLSGNILISKQESKDSKLIFIDYEYCDYNYRAYDIANHFCEFAGFEFNIKDNFPHQQFRLQFLRNYVTQMIPTADNNSSRYLQDALKLGLTQNDNIDQFLFGFEVRQMILIVTS